MHPKLSLTRWATAVAVCGLACACSSSSTPAADGGAPFDAKLSDSAPNDTAPPSDAGDADAAAHGSATLSGPVPGGMFNPVDAVAYDVRWVGPDGGMAGGAAVFITQYTPACGGVDAMNRSFLWINLYTPSPSLAPGTYPIVYSGQLTSGGAAADLTIATLDPSTCGVSAPFQAASGSVTLASVTAASIDGSLTVPLEGGALTGTFHAPYCATAGGLGCLAM